MQIRPQVNKFGYTTISYNCENDIQQWKVTFPNGYGASIVGGKWVQGDGVNTFELLVLKNDRPCYDTPFTDDVLAYLTEKEVTDVLKELEHYDEDEYYDAIFDGYIKRWKRQYGL